MQSLVQVQKITGKGIKIAIIDTGVDYTHPDLGNCTESQFLNGNCPKVIGGYDTYNNDTNPMDNNGHGTHCAGIAAGNGSTIGIVSPGEPVRNKERFDRGVKWLKDQGYRIKIGEHALKRWYQHSAKQEIEPKISIICSKMKKLML